MSVLIELPVDILSLQGFTFFPSCSVERFKVDLSTADHFHGKRELPLEFPALTGGGMGGQELQPS